MHVGGNIRKTFRISEFISVSFLVMNLPMIFCNIPSHCLAEKSYSDIKQNSGLSSHQTGADLLAIYEREK